MPVPYLPDNREQFCVTILEHLEHAKRFSHFFVWCSVVLSVHYNTLFCFLSVGVRRTAVHDALNVLNVLLLDTCNTWYESTAACMYE